MRRNKFFCLSLSRFAQASTAALIAIVLAGAARADTIEEVFIKDSAARNVSGGSLGCATGATCSFSGKRTVAGGGVTAPTLGSRVGFEGGSITAAGVGPGDAVGNPTIYSNLSGRITPVLERSSLALLGPGLLCCLGFALVWKRRSKAAHAQAFWQWRRAHHF